jgi:hypothetical protein
VRLNFNKEEQFSTYIGLIITLMCYVVVGIYGVQRLQVLIHRENPSIVTNEVQSAYSVDEFINLNEKGFKLAFGVYSHSTLKSLDDYSRIQWEVTIKTKKDQKTVEETHLEFSTCSDEDYADFFPVVQRNSHFLDYLKKENILKCIDRNQVLQIKGENNIDAAYININLKPCKPSADKKCADYSLHGLQDYLKKPEFVLYQNT